MRSEHWKVAVFVSAVNKQTSYLISFFRHEEKQQFSFARLKNWQPACLLTTSTGSRRGQRWTSQRLASRAWRNFREAFQQICESEPSWRSVANANWLLTDFCCESNKSDVLRVQKKKTQFFNENKIKAATQHWYKATSLFLQKNKASCIKLLFILILFVLLTWQRNLQTGFNNTASDSPKNSIFAGKYWFLF